MRADAPSLPMALPAQRRPSPHLMALLAVAAATVWAAHRLGLGFADLALGQGSFDLARDFFARALAPALRYESASPAAGAPPLLIKALEAAHETVVFAAAAMSLALPVGFLLSLTASASFWEDDLVPAVRRGGVLRRAMAAAAFGGSRVTIALMRSIHELLWAVLFLAAFGLTPLSAVVAIAIPFSGSFAKVVSEVIDEAPPEAADALRCCGASRLQVLLFGLLPRALGDMEAYAFYRFECALRSSAILGFFGLPTLGYSIARSFENLHFGEVWTYLYTLFALVVVVDWWSGAVRRRLVR